MAHNKSYALKKIKTREKKAMFLGRTLEFSNTNSYKYYKRHRRKFKHKEVLKHHEYTEITNLFTELIAEHLVNNPDGVFIEDIGYFGMLMVKTGGMSYKVFDTDYREVYEDFDLLSHSSGMSFSPHFVPIERSQILRTWVMDATANLKVKKNMIEKLKEGIKYRFNAPLFYQYTGQRKHKK